MLSLVLAVVAMAVPNGSITDVKAAVRALESRYARARTLKAAFLERYSDGKGAAQSESGTVYFFRPGRMRWDYESPEQKLFLVDGTNVWFYVPSDRTAGRRKIFLCRTAILSCDATREMALANLPTQEFRCVRYFWKPIRRLVSCASSFAKPEISKPNFALSF